MKKLISMAYSLIKNGDSVIKMATTSNKRYSLERAHSVIIADLPKDSTVSDIESTSSQNKFSTSSEPTPVL